VTSEHLPLVGTFLGGKRGDFCAVCLCGSLCVGRYGLRVFVLCVYVCACVRVYVCFCAPAEYSGWGRGAVLCVVCSSESMCMLYM
jgi:hypothetical protein